MTRRSAIVAIVLLALLIPGVAGLRFSLFLSRPVAPAEPRLVTIAPGSSFASVATKLAGEGVVASSFQLRLLARLRGDATRIQAGEYDFSEAATPQTVLDRLVAGDVRRLRFTVPEGLTVREIADKLAREGRGNRERFLRLGRDAQFIKTLGLDVKSLEGYLFPETYTLTADSSEEDLIRAMVREFRRKLTPELMEAARKRGLNTHQLVTLASIVQKEAGNKQEMPLIAAVFHNRIERGIPLQADPTVIYGIKDFDGNLTRKDLATPTPYNTYRMRGLPPGPIANPGEDALRAAAFPAAVDYLYFVSRGNGTHVFNATLREHNKAVRRYQLHR